MVDDYRITSKQACARPLRASVGSSLLRIAGCRLAENMLIVPL